MRKLLILLAAAGLFLATCKTTNQAEKHYKPVDDQWLSIEMTLVTEADLEAL